MLKSFIASSIRNARSKKLYTIIDLIGLTVAFVTFFLALNYVIHESSYDGYHSNSDRIYRVVSNNQNYRGFTKFPLMSSAMAPAFMEDFPETEAFMRLSPWGAQFQANGKNYYQSDWYFVDPAIFSMLSIKFLKGSPTSALESPTSIVLTESIALKFFGKTDIIGQEIMVKTNVDLAPLIVSGVIEDFPDNSIFTMKILTQFEATLKSVAPENTSGWGNQNYETYFLFTKKIDPAALQDRLDKFRKKYARESELENGELRSHFQLQPLRKIHFDTTTAFEQKIAVPIDRLLVIFLGATVVLLLAGVNYVNLSISRSITRAREIGVRKLVGAKFHELLFQLLFESILISVCSFIASILFVLLLLPYVNALLERTLELNIRFVSYMAAIAFMFGLMAGLYPAIVLSRMNSILVLKGKYSNTPKGIALQNALIVIQFSVSSILLICAFVIHKQLRFIQTMDPGYVTEQIVTINWRDRKLQNYGDALRNELLSLPFVKEVSFASDVPSKITSRETRRWVGNGIDQQVGFYTAYVDSKYIPLFEIQLIEGRNFNDDLDNDINSFIINETAVKELGIVNPIGMVFIENERDTIRVIGVVKDFHFESLRQSISPLRLRAQRNWISKVNVKFEMGNSEEAWLQLKKIVDKFAPEYPFDYTFFDDQYLSAYKQEKQIQAITTIITSIAFIIASLGVFGLISTSTNQKIREIGIRKIFGAGTLHLIWLITRKINLLILISLAISIPFANVLANEWLMGFAYRVNIEINLYVIAAIMIFILAWIIIFTKVFKTVNTNPIEILKLES